MKKYVLGTGLAAIAVLAVGCGSGDTGASPQQTDTTLSAAAESAKSNDQDIAFAQGMIPHHQQAVAMAKLAAETATNAQVKDLASRIEGAQAPEIEQLTGMLEKWGAPTEPSGSADPSMSNMPGMDQGGGMSGEGMMTDQEMRQLQQATGAEFDRMWVQMMIKHHQGAVAMAKTEVEKGANAEAKALAEKIIKAQEAEITEMQGISL